MVNYARTVFVSLAVLIGSYLYTRTPSPVFDYIIVGGGTSGLVAANRLVHNGASVLVLEAGPDSAHNAAVTTAGMFGSTLNSDIDWKYEMGMKLPMPRGRTLGGSSAVNFLLWNRPADVEIDAWEHLGANGWNWDSLLNAMKQIESFHPPSAATMEAFGIEESADPSLYGKDGGIHLSYPRFATAMDKTWFRSMQAMGNPLNTNPASGDNVGANISPITMNPANFTRSYSASAFIDPIRHNPNLTILDNTTVSRINTRKQPNGDIRATGVEYIRDGMSHSVNARNKVVLAAGTISTPQILELSGIGDREVLERHGIETVLHQPSVGENLQDHTYVTSVFEVDNSIRSVGLVHTNATIAEQELAKLGGPHLSLLEQANVCVAYLTPAQVLDDGDKQRLGELMEELEGELASGKHAGVYEEQYKQQLAFLQDERVTQSEYINVGFFADVHHAPEVNKTYATLLAANQHAFARGSVHIKSADPLVHPRIDPRYLSHEIDVLLQKAALKYTRRIANQPPFTNLVLREAYPGSAVDSDQEWEEYVREHVFGEYHAIGTARMGRAEDGAVVDGRLKVYGTENLHVIDASVMPLHVSAHIQSVVYAIASRSTLYL